MVYSAGGLPPLTFAAYFVFPRQHLEVEEPSLNPGSGEGEEEDRVADDVVVPIVRLATDTTLKTMHSNARRTL